MPEGPSILILKELVPAFKGKRVVAASGNTKKIDLKKLKGKKILDFKSWGKHFLICFDDFTIRIHFLMFGSYSINERKEREPRLRLEFKDSELNFYTCSIILLTDELDEIYDWSGDVMNEQWDPAKAKEKIKDNPDRMVCDVLLDQDIFAGVGNIIKNEVLYRINVHPASKAKDLPTRKINELIKEAVNYSFEFLKWKKLFILRQQWLVHTRTQCVRCKGPIIKEYMGKTNRRTFFCPNCQKMYFTP